MDFRLDFRPRSEKIDLGGATDGTSIVKGSRGRGCGERNDVGRYSPEERRIPDATREY